MTILTLLLRSFLLYLDIDTYRSVFLLNPMIQRSGHLRTNKIWKVYQVGTNVKVSLIQVPLPLLYQIIFLSL